MMWLNQVPLTSCVVVFFSSTALISEAWREELKDLATKVSLSAAASTKRSEHEVEEHTHDHYFL